MENSIDREKVIAGLTMLVDRKNDDTCEGLKCCKIAEDVLELLKEQESIINELQNAYAYLQKQFFEVQDKLLKEQEAETGRWIYKKYDDMFMCSCCEKYSIRNDYPYCHWCGAKMEGRQVE